MLGAQMDSRDHSIPPPARQETDGWDSKLGAGAVGTQQLFCASFYGSKHHIQHCSGITKCPRDKIENGLFEFIALHWEKECSKIFSECLFFDLCASTRTLDYTIILPLCYWSSKGLPASSSVFPACNRMKILNSTSDCSPSSSLLALERNQPSGYSIKGPSSSHCFCLTCPDLW